MYDAASWGREMDFEVTKLVLVAMEAESVQYVICGGVAVNLLGLPRATEDLDIFIAPQPENVERLKAALFRVFRDPLIGEIDASELLGDYPAVQYIPPLGTFHIDILVRLGDTFCYADLQSRRLDFDGVQVSVATPETLVRMKKDTVRPRDWDDAISLRRRFGLKGD